MHSNQSPSLGQLPLAFASQPGVRALAKKLWGAGEIGLSVGLPRWIRPKDLSSFVRTDDVAAEFSRVPGDGVSRGFALFPRSDAARWVDRVLGGEGNLGRAAKLREAELGVLAYVLSRLFAERMPSLQLSDVHEASLERIGSRIGGCVIWPFGLQTPLGLVDLRLLLSEELALRLDAPAVVSLQLPETLDAQALAKIEQGDVLLSDNTGLTLTVDGLVGDVELRVVGIAELGRVRLEPQRLSALPSAATRRSDDAVALCISEGSLSLLALSQLVGGQVEVPWTAATPSEMVSLLCADAIAAEGALVVHRGKLGIRIASMLLGRHASHTGSQQAHTSEAHSSR